MAWCHRGPWPRKSVDPISEATRAAPAIAEMRRGCTTTMRQEHASDHGGMDAAAMAVGTAVRAASVAAGAETAESVAPSRTVEVPNERSGSPRMEPRVNGTDASALATSALGKSGW
eukprot:scaffold79282_cov29-Tisochrysis_lutea.AAC.4